MGRGEWEKICFKRSQRYCSTISFCAQLLGEPPVGWCSCFPCCAHLSLASAVLRFIESNVWRKRYRLPHLPELSEILTLTLSFPIKKFVLVWQWEIKHFILIIILFYSFLLPKRPKLSFLPGLCFCAISKSDSWSIGVYLLNGGHEVVQDLS